MEEQRFLEASIQAFYLVGLFGSKETLFGEEPFIWLFRATRRGEGQELESPLIQAIFSLSEWIHSKRLQDFICCCSQCQYAKTQSTDKEESLRLFFQIVKLQCLHIWNFSKSLKKPQKPFNLSPAYVVLTSP